MVFCYYSDFRYNYKYMVHFALEVSPWDVCYVFLLHIHLGYWLTFQLLATMSSIMTLIFGSRYPDGPFEV